METHGNGFAAVGYQALALPSGGSASYLLLAIIYCIFIHSFLHPQEKEKSETDVGILLVIA